MAHAEGICVLRPMLGVHVPPKRVGGGMLTVLWCWACLESPDVPAHWLTVRLFSSLPASSWQQRRMQSDSLSQKEMVQLATAPNTLFVPMAHANAIRLLPRFYPESIAFSW